MAPTAIHQGEELAESRIEVEVEKVGESSSEQPVASSQFEKLVLQDRCDLSEIRRVPVPPHRYSPLRKHWSELIDPLVKILKLHIRMNTRRRCVEIKNSSSTDDLISLQKSTEYIRAFLLGFEIQDSLALLRLDDLFLESFQISDVKKLEGGHMSRCIGRVSGKSGRTKYAIENATRSRIVIADSKIHILGSFQSIKLARDSICHLILGSPAGKVYNRLRTVSKRLQERS